MSKTPELPGCKPFDSENIREEIAEILCNEVADTYSTDVDFSWEQLDELEKGNFREIADQILSYLKSQIEQMENPIRDIYPVDEVTDIIRARTRGYDEAIQDILAKL